MGIPAGIRAALATCKTWIVGGCDSLRIAGTAGWSVTVFSYNIYYVK